MEEYYEDTDVSSAEHSLSGEHTVIFDDHDGIEEVNEATVWFLRHFNFKCLMSVRVMAFNGIAFERRVIQFQSIRVLLHMLGFRYYEEYMDNAA